MGSCAECKHSHLSGRGRELTRGVCKRDFNGLAAWGAAGGRGQVRKPERVTDTVPTSQQTLPQSGVVLQVSAQLLVERVTLETGTLRHLVVLIPDTELPHRRTHCQ